MQRDTWRNTQRAWAGSGYPFTIGLIVLEFISLLLATGHHPIYPFLSFTAPTDFAQPWRILTYTLCRSGEFIGFLLTSLLIYSVCGSLERSWSSRNFAFFYFSLSVICGVAMSLASLVAKIEIPVSSMLVTASLVVAWGTVNAEQGITFWFIPMRGIHIAALAAMYIAFTYAAISLLIMPFALVGCAVAFKWVRHPTLAPGYLFAGPLDFGRSTRPALRLVPRNPARPPRPKDDRLTLRSLNPFAWLARNRDRKKFERLMRDD